jgi:hypothetical protein
MPSRTVAHQRVVDARVGGDRRSICLEDLHVKVLVVWFVGAVADPRDGISAAGGEHREIWRPLMAAGVAVDDCLVAQLDAVRVVAREHDFTFAYVVGIPGNDEAPVGKIGDMGQGLAVGRRGRDLRRRADCFSQGSVPLKIDVVVQVYPVLG